MFWAIRIGGGAILGAAVFAFLNLAGVPLSRASVGTIDLVASVALGACVGAATTAIVVGARGRRRD